MYLSFVHEEYNQRRAEKCEVYFLKMAHESEKCYQREQYFRAMSQGTAQASQSGNQLYFPPNTTQQSAVPVNRPSTFVERESLLSACAFHATDTDDADTICPIDVYSNGTSCAEFSLCDYASTAVPMNRPSTFVEGSHFHQPVHTMPQAQTVQVPPVQSMSIPVTQQVQNSAYAQTVQVPPVQSMSIPVTQQVQNSAYNVQPPPTILQRPPQIFHVAVGGQNVPRELPEEGGNRDRLRNNPDPNPIPVVFGGHPMAYLPKGWPETINSLPQPKVQNPLATTKSIPPPLPSQMQVPPKVHNPSATVKSIPPPLPLQKQVPPKVQNPSAIMKSIPLAIPQSLPLQMQVPPKVQNPSATGKSIPLAVAQPLPSQVYVPTEVQNFPPAVA
ncbi:pollen-specific leucine-rich repeat extensin-like protein 1 [Cornus florida]|uniref:pollen-specific leucine-rich repeat extensin-like protein 1 n=1 Tax=Cornus florida TaxID=4283 RepID=UPI002898C8C2|nr:pollen-specific leucine-rich repeat extensin-like protein 1 [Cornus florida]